MLLCLEEDVSFNAYADIQMDHLQRQLKARSQGSSARHNICVVITEIDVLMCGSSLRMQAF